MLEYLEKFKALNPELREAVSNASAVANVTALEKEFGTSLSELVIRIMVRDIALSAVPGFLVSDLKIELSKADALYQRLRQDILAPVLPYLEKIPNVQSPQTGTKHIIDVEDEEEVKLLAQKTLQSIDTSPDWNEAAAKIIDLAKLSFGSEVLNMRLKTILTTYLKGVRNKVDTKLLLQKSIAEGGVAVDDGKADQIISLAGEFVIKPDLAPLRPKFSVPEDSLIGRDIPYDFAREMERREQDKNKGKNVATTNIVDPYSFGRPKEVVGKVTMNDVKATAPKIMNQLDELRFTDLVIFRRLSGNPEEATARIKEKIELLEYENYHKRLEGIKSWRQSPINRIYLRICELAITDNLAVEKVIANLQAGNAPCLSPAEFVAIMKLNKELRF